MSIRQNFPTTPPSLVLDFANSKTLDPRITFSRTTTATRMNELGLIETVDADVARFDHKYENGVIKSLGLLVEEQRINYVYDSTDPTWNSIRGGWTSPTDIISPDGTTNYVGLYTEDGQTGSHHIKIPGNTPAYTIADDTIVTGSAWIKNNGKDAITFGFNDKNDGYPRGFFNFNTEDVYDVTANYSLSVIKYPNDWYRFIFTGNGGSGTSRPGPILSIFMVQNGTTGITGYTGDTTSGVYVWGPQLEIGSFPTSYIPTSGSTATRNPDTTQITGINLNSWFNPNEGTFIINHKWNTLDTFVDSLFAVSTNGSSGINLYDVTSSAYGAGLQYPSTNNFQEITEVGSYKYGLTYNSTSRATVKDGGTVIEDANGFTSLNTANRLSIGMDRGNNWHGSKTISKLTYYPTRLSNDNLQNLTK